MFRYEGVNWEGRQWRTAASITRLGHQVEEIRPGTWPNDGTVASEAHDRANPTSDHRPDSYGTVRAIDVTEPSPGWADRVTEVLRGSRDPRIRYVIHDRHIFSPVSEWEWRMYHGENPHTSHFHLSVVSDSRAELDYAWTLTEPEDDTMLPLKLGDGTGDRIAKRSDVAAVQGLLNIAGKTVAGYVPLLSDGRYGPKTADAVLAVLGTEGSDVGGNELAALIQAVARAEAPPASGITAEQIVSIVEAAPWRLTSS